VFLLIWCLLIHLPDQFEPFCFEYIMINGAKFASCNIIWNITHFGHEGCPRNRNLKANKFVILFFSFF
jgi:hypothetical protein